MDESIANTYVKHSTGTNKNSLYDSYIRGIRWASNRIENSGVIAFVSNGSFIDGNTADGIRKTFANEFSRIFIYNLRGNARTSGEQRRKESGNVFKEGSRALVSIAVLIKNSDHVGPAEIQYRDIGDYLTREQKLDILSTEQSLESTDWETITPNEHGDWVNHRDERYDIFQPLGEKTSKRGLGTNGIFESYSSGLKTNRDAWCYNFSRDAVEQNMRRMIANYEIARQPDNQKIDTDPKKVSWNRSLLSDASKGKEHNFEKLALVPATYRPFTKQTVYFSREMNDMIYQLPKIFPSSNHLNFAITFPNPGPNSRAASPLIINQVMDTTAQTVQCFPLYTYELVNAKAQEDLFAEIDTEVMDGYRRKDNITDPTLATYRSFYKDSKLGKEDIFYYVYGLLHSPTYKEKYKADLMKMLPRIPKVADFWGFSTTGRALADLHLNYESVEPFPLEEQSKTSVFSSGDDYGFYSVKKLSFASRKDRSTIIYNQSITLAGIPDETYDYQINGKSALEWIIDRYQVTTHKASQITNDPNDYSREVGNPRYVIDLIKRIVTVSIETNKLVASLPELDIIE